MKNVKSLRAGIFSEIVMVILPLAALLIYQSVSDITASGRLAEAYRLHAASLSARQEYRLFLNGVVDAVDTGRVTEDAVRHLAGSAGALRSTGSVKSEEAFRALAGKAEALLEKVRRDRTLTGLLPLRESINGLDRDMAALDLRCDQASRGMIQRLIDAARSRKKMVFMTLIPVVWSPSASSSCCCGTSSISRGPCATASSGCGSCSSRSTPASSWSIGKRGPSPM